MPHSARLTSNGTARASGLPLIQQPPYAPELNPAERVWVDVFYSASSMSGLS
jgi:transposase